MLPLLVLLLPLSLSALGRPDELQSEPDSESLEDLDLDLDLVRLLQMEPRAC